MAYDDLAHFIDRYTVEYLRTFPHPIERVWKAIVDPAEIGRWFVPPTKWDLRTGGAYRFHDDDMSGAILAYDPPRLIRFQDTPKNGPDAWFQFELEPAPGGTLMRFRQYTTPGVATQLSLPGSARARATRSASDFTLSEVGTATVTNTSLPSEIGTRSCAGS